MTYCRTHTQGDGCCRHRRISGLRPRVLVLFQHRSRSKSFTMLPMTTSCCGRSLKTGATIVGIFYLVVSTIGLIYCIVNVAFVLNGDEVSLLDSSHVYKLFPKEIQDKLSTLTTQQKNEIYKSISHPIIKFQDVPSASGEASGLAIVKLIMAMLHVLSNICLLIGVRKEDANLVFTWLWTQVVLFFLSSGIAIIMVLSFISNLNILGECLLVACIILYLGVSLYCFSVINSFYQYLYEPLPEQKGDYDRSTLQLV